MTGARLPWALAAAALALLLIALLPAPAAAVVFEGSDFQGLQPPLSTSPPPVPGCTTYWYSQRLDHFSRHDKRRWQQRYTLCNAYWNPNAKKQAVYMYLGNESPLPGAWPTIFSDMARDQGGLLLYAEHRYYGESMPLGSRSLTNEGLVYLTVEQVLADYAELIEAVRKIHRVPRSAPTVCYGGSYGGNLAAYLRLTYPRQFDAALASSAVVKFLMPSIPFLKTKYDAYKARLAASTCKFHAAINILTHALRDAAGDECAARVDQAYLAMQGPLAYSAQGRQQLATALHMCDPAALDSSEAVSAVGAAIRDTWQVPLWWGTFQTLYRTNPTFNAAAAMCKIVNAAPNTDLGVVEGMALAVIAAAYEDSKCITSDAAIFPFGSKDNGPNATADPTMRAWLYQASYWCILLTFFSHALGGIRHAQATGIELDTFPWASAKCCRQGFPVSTHLWSAYPSVYGYWAMPAPFFINWCKRVYGIKQPLQYPRQYEYTPHKLFARTSNLIFSNGEYDPWAAGSVFTAQAPRVPAIMTPKASHRQDLSAAQAGNTAAFNATQRQIKAWISEWVLRPKQHWKSDS
ncbi:hypothetical protein COHA_002916 [Chlorella ohadii]|uniref:Lysosomal Pro-X carboxypeptidase n=1 Tax=Chlorella ohadii TaxID=2649997 RepID=A0AAD5H779_9CHLO|nr:hypothetical protein COHA_002916 [Chlorella ohadii]